MLVLRFARILSSVFLILLLIPEYSYYIISFSINQTMQLASGAVGICSQFDSILYMSDLSFSGCFVNLDSDYVDLPRSIVGVFIFI